MSDSQIVVVDLDVSAADAPAVAERVRQWLLDEQIIVDEAESDWRDVDRAGPGWRATTEPGVGGASPDGIGATVGPHVHLPAENIGSSARCPVCGALVDSGAWVELASPVFTEWIEGSGVDRVPCPSCGAGHRTHGWLWDDGEPWALGFLGLTFWNWPELSDDFLARLRHNLDGHETCVINVHL
ncbi:MAG: hypothetical protein QM728_07845 [Gordonia sp. (in: high G+C Gram-positive bacteria)]|uniref:hypothetical protein n=1 Tax=Gordonia sp. (in: high G+C Gram-positive bacteria) TaxID=84139 RepID=UPI0039E33647